MSESEPEALMGITELSAYPAPILCLSSALTCCLILPQTTARFRFLHRCERKAPAFLWLI